MVLKLIVRIVRTAPIIRRMFAHRSFIAGYNVKGSSGKLIIAAPLVGLLAKFHPATHIDTKENILLEADALFEQGKYLQIYEKLKDYKDGEESAEILWRLSRALYHMSRDAGKPEAKAMIYEAYDIISKALSLKDDDHAIHKWYVILVDAKTRYEGKKAQIQILQMVKDHMLRSHELNPKDATVLYMLGNWCYHVADLAWYQKKIAAIAFAEPPDSSFEEALQFLLKAEEMDPYFYSHNLLLIGKTFMKLNRKDEARKYLKMASEYPVKSTDDHDAQQEATKLLGSL